MARGKAYSNPGGRGRAPMARVMFDAAVSGADVLRRLRGRGHPVSQGAFSDYVNGRRAPKPEVAQRFAEVLGVPVEELFVMAGDEKR